LKAHSLVSSWKEGQIIVWIYVISPDYRVSQCWLKLMFYVRADLMLISNFCDIYIFIEEGDIGISSMAMTLYNYCLHMRWTSKIINTRVVIFSKGFSPSENHLSRVDNLMFTSYEGNDCFIIPKLKKKRIFNTLPVVRDCRPGDNLLSPSTLYMFGLFTGLSPSSANFQ
jgi:hypothetical protein